MKFRIDILFQKTIFRYLFSVVAVASAFALRMWLVRLTGMGAPFVMFFAAVLVTSLLAGVGPGICALLISMPLASYTFVMRAGYPRFQTFFQALLFATDGSVVIYLTYLMKKGRQALQEANQQLRQANEEITKSMARTREVIELSPDAFFQADLEARFTDVNQAACRLLGYDRDELLGKTVFDVIPLEDAARLKAIRAELSFRDKSTEPSGDRSGRTEPSYPWKQAPTSCRMAGGRLSCGTSASASASNWHCRNRRSDSGSLSMRRRSGWRSLGSMGISSASIVRSARSSATLPPN